MNENKTAITELIEWMENEDALVEEKRIDFLYLRILDKAKALESSQTEKDKGLVEDGLWEKLKKRGYMITMFEYYRLGNPAAFWALRIAKIDFPENWREYRGPSEIECIVKMWANLLMEEETDHQGGK